jgi:4-hydroxy-2-oxoheptanedioate aldolase
VIVLFIGPWDLGNNLGYPVQGDFAPELKQAITRILKAATAANKKAGIYCPSGDFARRYADEGFHMAGNTDRTGTSLTP